MLYGNSIFFCIGYVSYQTKQKEEGENVEIDKRHLKYSSQHKRKAFLHLGLNGKVLGTHSVLVLRSLDRN